MKKAIIFGASYWGKEAYQELREDYDIIYFSDNDACKWNQQFCEKEILPPNELLHYKDELFIIASRHHAEIKKQLVDYGIYRLQYFDYNKYIIARENGKTEQRELYFKTVLFQSKQCDVGLRCLSASEVIRAVEFRESLLNNIRYALDEGDERAVGLYLCEWERIEPLSLERMACEAELEIRRNNYKKAQEILSRGMKISLDNEEILRCNKLLDECLKTEESKMRMFIRQQLEGKGAVENDQLNGCNTGAINVECLKVLHGTFEASQQGIYCEGLRQIGVYAKSINYCSNSFRFQADESYSMIDYSEEKRRLIEQSIAARLIPEFDIFHFHFGQTLTEDKSDIEVIQELGKKVVFNFWGSEIRLKSIAKRICPNIEVKYDNEEQIRRKIEDMGRRVKDCIVCDHELLQYVKDYFDNVHIVRQALNLDSFFLQTESLVHTKKVKILHAPTSTKIKRTDIILQVIDKIKKKYDIEFVLGGKWPHEEFLRKCREADIIIDSIGEGAYGITAMEAMAYGKTVVSEISEFMEEFYPKELPIVKVTAETLYASLCALIEDEKLRKEIGIQGRKYVEKYHDSRVIAQSLVKIYKNL